MRIDRDAPLRFIRTAFPPDDWIAVLLKRHDTGEAVQRVGPVGMVLDPRFQGWLRFKNARRFNVFVSVNALTPGRRSRTRESVSAVRHVFLDADEDVDRVLGALDDRQDLPMPSWVLRSSKDRAHVLWRVDGFSVERAEALQKHLARELGTDVAATSVAQMTRLPGFFNHKYTPPPLVAVDNDATSPSYDAHAFPEVSYPTTPKPSFAVRDTARRGRMPTVERARRYLAATPPAIQGHRGDELTFRVCCRLWDRFGLTEDEALSVLKEWNRGCEPPWTSDELVRKLRRSRGYAEASRCFC